MNEEQEDEEGGGEGEIPGKERDCLSNAFKEVKKGRRQDCLTRVDEEGKEY